MNKLKLGKEYPTLDGSVFTVIREDTSNGKEDEATVSCSDTYHRYSSGKWAGLWCGRENTPNYHHHVDWSKVVDSSQLQHQQLDLFE